MTVMNYQLKIENQAQNNIAVAWLKLGVGALLFAGIFTILLVFARTPAVQEIIPLTDFFHVALVVHVDLSVLIWFISFAGVLWSLSSKTETNNLDRIAIGLAILGTVILIVAPFFGIAAPLMNNYIPLLDHPIYIAGLITFAIGMLLQILRTIAAGLPNLIKPDGSDALRVGIYVSAWVALFALLALVASYLSIPKVLEGTSFYEILFWGGGHILQFTHTILLLVAWIWLASATGVTLRITPKALTWLLILVAVPVLATPFIYLQYDIISLDHRTVFTDLMKYGGLASIPLGLYIAVSILRSGRRPDNKPLNAALYSSIILFAMGGIIGFMIEGSNVIIPAHYHGSIVGVTLAFMGLSYHLLPLLGFTKPTSRMAQWQPYVYGGGQLMHVLGLAYSGGHGVQRKVSGSAQGLDNISEILGMAVMGVGGAIAIVGGLLFVIVMIKAFMKKEIA